MSILTLISQVIAYDDEDAVSNPSQKPVDWRRNIANLPVENPGTEKVTIEALGSKVLFDGARTLTIDETTEFSLAPSDLEPSRYRVNHTAGAVPGFREPREVDTNTIELTLDLAANLSMTITAGTGNPFTDAEIGDVLFIPGPTTGDPATPFNSLNEGYWTIIGVTGSVLTVIRDPKEVFSGVGEVVTPTDAGQLQVFSAAGVQVGDTAELIAGFVATSRGAFEIVGVNPSWLEIVSTIPLPSQSGVLPDEGGLVVYTAAKRFIRIETDQSCVVRLNGDQGNSNVLAPWVPGDKRFPAEFTKVGNVWKLELVNRASVPVAVLVITAE